MHFSIPDTSECTDQNGSSFTVSKENVTLVTGKLPVGLVHCSQLTVSHCLLCKFIITGCIFHNCKNSLRILNVMNI